MTTELTAGCRMCAESAADCAARGGADRRCCTGCDHRRRPREDRHSGTEADARRVQGRNWERYDSYDPREDVPSIRDA